MATQHANATEGGQNGPSESVVDDPELLKAFARVVGEMVSANRAALTPEAQIQIDLRSEPRRHNLIMDMVKEIVPSGVSPALWRKWLSGEGTPFNAKGLQKPVKLSHGVGKEISRGPSSLRPLREKVEKAREELAFAEQALAYQEALDKSLLEWCITDQLLGVMEPMFAMGPAWTVMRAISAHVSDAEVDAATVLLDGEEKEREKEIYRGHRAEETERLLEAFDYFCGFEPFERAVRAQLLDVVESFEKRRPEAAGQGRRARLKGEMRKHANPEGMKDSQAVLEGLGPRAAKAA